MSGAPKVQIYVLPGGIMPERKSGGAAGYDVAARAVVSPREMDPQNPIFRRTLFDFESMPEDPDVYGHVHKLGGELVYRMEPGESVLMGIGFVTALPPDVLYVLLNRSGLISKLDIVVKNALTIVDSDYRGEAGVLLYNQSNKYFDLRHGMRIAQIVFQRAEFPEFEAIGDYADLPKTARGAGAFGSTGLLSNGARNKKRRNRKR